MSLHADVPAEAVRQHWAREGTGRRLLASRWTGHGQDGSTNLGARFSTFAFTDST
ncbi:MAG: hypothetical protein WEF50_16085 [Myxococcota bacterium]